MKMNKRIMFRSRTSEALVLKKVFVCECILMDLRTFEQRKNNVFELIPCSDFGINCDLVVCMTFQVCCFGREIFCFEFIIIWWYERVLCD